MSSPTPWLAITHTRSGSTLKEFKNALLTLSAKGSSEAVPVAVMVGRKVKSEFLRNWIQGADKSFLYESHGQVHLWRSNQNFGNANDIVFIDHELQIPNASQWNNVTGEGPQKHRVISWTNSLSGPWTRRRIGNLLCARVFGLLSCVICYFASDLGGSGVVAELLAEQAVEKPASDLPEKCLPPVFVVLETVAKDFDAATAEMELREHILQTMKDKNLGLTDADVQSALRSHLPEIRIVGMRNTFSIREKSDLLRQRIKACQKDQHYRRVDNDLRFSTSHINAFADLLLDHFCRQSSSTFSFVEASRPQGFTLEHFETHLDNVLAQLPSEVWLNHLACPLLASALLFASYTPDSHRTLPGQSHYTGSTDLAYRVSSVIAIQQAIQEYNQDLHLYILPSGLDA